METSVRKGGTVVRSGQTDIFVVGGGPAGLAAAIAARRKGFQVTVADGAAPPIEKPCGEGMMPETLAVLNVLGVNFAPEEGFRFRGVSFIQQGATVSADFAHGRGLGLRRPALHEGLWRAAENCGVRILWKTPVRGMQGQTVQLSCGTIRARWIVGADGHGSRIRRWSGLDSAVGHERRYANRRHYQVRPWSNRMEVYWGSTAQGYVTPIASDEVCVVTMGNTPQAASFHNALNDLPELRERLAGARLGSRERGAVSAMLSLQRVQRGNVVLLGDASGGVDAITGEGLRMAFQQALALADALVTGDLQPYQRAHRKIARRPMLMGNLMLWLSRHSPIRERAIRAMQQRPDLFTHMLATHMGEATPMELLFTGAQLGLRLLDASEKG